MKTRTKSFLSIALCAACAVAIGTAFAALRQEKTEYFASAASGITASMNDFDSKSFVFTPSTNADGGIQYTFTDDSALSLAGQTGIVIRVKNLSDVQCRTYQLRIFVDGSTLVYSPYGSNTYFYWQDGSVTNTSSTARDVYIPANFDGYMLLPFDQMTILRHSAAGSNWVWSERNHLSADGTGDFALPTGNVKQIAFFMASAFYGKEMIFGAHSTYTQTDTEYTLATPIYADYAAAVKPSSEPLPTIVAYPEAKVTVNLQVNGVSAVSDASIDLGVSETTQMLAYGEKLNVNPVVPLGYALNRIELSGLVTETRESASFFNTYKVGGTLTVNFITEETAQVTVSDNNVSLTDKTGIKVTVNELTAALRWRLSITDGTNLYTASTGAGIIQTDYTVYGNVFTLEEGFAGTIYIPFNVYRGSTYGGKQNTPFDYATAEDKPASVTGKIYLESLTGQTKEELAQIFSDWEYVTALPAISKASAENANLFDEGDGDFIGGTSVSPNVALTANQAGSASNPVSYAFKLTPENSASFNVAGYAFRVKNVSGADFGWRTYLSASNGKIFVPQAANTFTLISSDGTVTQGSHNNRNVIIPKDFDGTVLVSFADFATDTLIFGAAENVDRSELNISYIRVYCGGGTEGVLLGEVGSVAYDGTYTPVLCSIDELNANQNQFALTTIAAASVTVDNADVTASPSGVIYGTSEVNLTPAAGKLITSVTVPSGCTYEKNTDGTVTVTIVRSVKAAEDAYAITAVTDDVLQVTINATANGSVLYLGADATGGFVVPASADYQITVTPDAGYRAEATIGTTALNGMDNVYTVPAGTAAVNVSFIRLSATLTATLSGNGTAKFDGSALENGAITLDQGDTKLLTVSPALGYDCTVKLNDDVLTAGENGYEIAIYENSELTITFTIHQYKITYDLDRGTNGVNPATYTVNDKVTFVAATKEGYNFLGWFVTENGVEKAITGIESGSVGDIAVFAKFEIIAQEAPEEPGEGVPVWGWCLIGVGCALALAGGAVAVVFVLKKKKGRKHD